MKLFNKGLSLLLAVALLLSCVYTGAGSATAATVGDYIASCTTYPANLNVKTTESTSLMSHPCTAEVDSASLEALTVEANTILPVHALYKNTAGEYWYWVLYQGMSLYVKATDTTMKDHLTGDVKITNAQSPASLAQGNVFSIKGDISSTYNDLASVTASMYEGSDYTVTPTLNASANVNGKSYSLEYSAIDYALTFNSLEAGVYTYVVTAKALSYYINDNGKLATSTRTVVLESRECVITEWENPSEPFGMGITVSAWNGDIDWKQAASEIDFAIIRASWECTTDLNFADNAKGCIDNDVPFGVYVYSYAENAEEATAEAEYVLSLVKGYTLDLPIWLYMGDDVQATLSTGELRDIATAFCDTIRAAGYEPGLYSSLTWFNSYFSGAYFSAVPKWVIQVDNLSENNTCTYDGGTWMWTTSNTGSVSGITGDVSLNYYYASLPGVVTNSTYLSKCTYYPSHANATTNAVVNLRPYPSTNFTRLGTVADGAEVEITGVFKNDINEWWYQVIVDGTYGYIRCDWLDITGFLFDDVAVINPVMATELLQGKGYPLYGEMVSLYNNLHAVSANVYAGDNTNSTAVLSSNYVLNGKNYNLYRSKVCTNLVFNDLDAGSYTYELAANIRNCYVVDGRLTYSNKYVVLWTAPFTVMATAEGEPQQDYYLFGYINGADYACEADYENLGEYKFVDGKLTATFTEDSYVAVKAADNLNWYMTAGWQGMDATDVTLYNTVTLNNSDKMFVPGGVEVVFSLRNAGDDSFILSYEIPDACTHDYVGKVTTAAGCETEGVTTYSCSKCGDSYTEAIAATGHNFVNGVCTDCNAYAEYYLFGYINGANYACEEDYENMGEYKFVDGKLTATFTEDSYVGIKTGDNLHWYMTDGWLGNVLSATLYNTTTITTADKLLVPGGVEVNFTLVVNDDDTFTLSYAIVSDCDHNYSSQVATAATCEAAGVKTYTCANCDHSYTEIIPALGHKYENGKCSVCGGIDPELATKDYYLFGYINGANYACEEDYENLGEYKFVGSKVTATFTENSYVAVKTSDNANWYMTNGWLGEVNSATLYNTSKLGANANKLFVPGGVEVTFTLVANADDTLSLSYAVKVECNHSYTAEETTAPGCVTEGIRTYTCSKCGDTYTESITAIGHKYTGTVTTAATCDKAGVKTFTCSGCNTGYTQSIPALGHKYADGICSVCGGTDPDYVPATDYYLFGSINGANYGCEEDAENMGQYKFVDGKLVATFTSDSYVAVKTSDNAAWYMTDGWLGTDAKSATLYNTAKGIDANKLYVPGGVEITFTLVVNGDDTLTLSADYEVAVKEFYVTGTMNDWNVKSLEHKMENADGIYSFTFELDAGKHEFKITDGTWAGSYPENNYVLDLTVASSVTIQFNSASKEITVESTALNPSVKPTITLRYPSLTFESEVYMNVYFNITNNADVVQLGMILSDDATAEITDDLIDEFEVKTSGTYTAVRSPGIPAKELGESHYIGVYAKLADGTYTFSKLNPYSALAYAKDRLANSSNMELKRLCVAMLNYGAAAQAHMNYNTSNLANASLTEEQRGYIDAYSSSMVKGVGSVDAQKVGAFAFNGFGKRYPSVSFEGAFAISYYFTPSYTPENGVKLYYWDEAAYNAASVLTIENATGCVDMEINGTAYKGSVTGIAAKEIDSVIYVSGVYEYNGTTYATGVLPYSLGSYCVDRAANGTAATMRDLGAATAVYGYYAKLYFDGV